MVGEQGEIEKAAGQNAGRGDVDPEGCGEFVGFHGLHHNVATGVHRDDLDIKLSNHVFRYIASQGQRKSLLFALKLAEMDALKRPGLPGERENGFAPLLLLDDVFEKLDEDRISNLLYKVCAENRGQVFITDTSEARLKEHLEKINIRFGMIRL